MKKVVIAVVLIVAIAGVAWYFMVLRHPPAQKRTVADVRNAGTAMFSWLVDQVGVAPEAPALYPNHVDPAYQKGRAMLVRAEPTPFVSFASLTLAAPTPLPQNIQSVDVGSYKKRTVEEVEKLLVPEYIQAVPRTDGWGHAYEYYLDTENPVAERVMLIRSPGRDGKFSGSVYQIGPFEPGSFDEDIVWADGYFVRWPQAQPPAQ